MNNYELMVIFTPVLSEEEFKAAQKKYADLVTENGGEVLHSNPWGLKSLAYPIDKKTTGLYWVMEYKAPTSFNEKLKIQLLRDESQIVTCTLHSTSTPSTTMRKREVADVLLTKKPPLNSWQKMK